MIGEGKFRLRTYLRHVTSDASLTCYCDGFVTGLGVAIAAKHIVASTGQWFVGLMACNAIQGSVRFLKAGALI